jgi:DMSO/TMAO reductase YedYZ molybdopterin-dependent catalytic subunit
MRRRDLLRASAGLLFARHVGGVGLPRGPDLIVRSARPQNLETPVGLLDTDIVPLDAFFVRSHFGVPAVDAASWTLRIGGLVEKELTLGLDDLKKLPQTTLPAVLQCAGNGRAFHRPRVPGVPWERGAMGQARWSGPRLKDVLALAKPKSTARFIRLRGADGPPMPTTPAFMRSVPIEKAMHPATILAHAMNDAPLHPLHGAPLRSVLPGWVGDDWVKWLVEIQVDDKEDAGFFQSTAYRMPKTPGEPGVAVKPEDTAPMTTMVVKSIITKPFDGQKLSPGATAITGIAFAGEDAIAKVEVSIDGGKIWQSAILDKSAGMGAWQRWHIDWVALSGSYDIRARATDAKGRVQPDATAWNPSGYLWNGIDSVKCEIG